MKREYYKMGLVFFIGSISLLFIILISVGTNHKLNLILAFHQNYPEFDNEDDVKDLYEILKDSPYFKSKIIRLENITNDVSIGCNIETLMLDEVEEKKTATNNLEMCDEDIQAMKVECDKHYNVMRYCKEKSDFITSYMVTRNLTEESVGKVASVLPK
jgi:hypothetical protein